MTYRDRVRQTATTAGTGPFTLGPATAGHRAIADAYGVGDLVPYCIESQTPGEWEVGVGTLTAPTTLARTTVTASSNSGALVDFAAGAKNVMVTAPASELNKLLSSDTIAYSAAIPLNRIGTRFMPQQTVASVIGFTVAASPVQGASVYVRLVADGVNVPTFTGMKQWGSSQTYDNRAGFANQVRFFYDGVDSWYSIRQAVGAVVEPGFATSQLNTFGDSFSVGAGATSMANGWNTLYAAALGIPLLNKGISGTVLQNRNDSGGSPRADNGLSRYVAALITGASLSSKYAILYGFNDARYTAASATMNVTNFIADYRTILTGMIAAGISASDIRIGSPGYITDTGLTTGSTGFTGQTRVGFEAYVAAVQQVAGEFGVTYVPVYEYMRDNGGASLISGDNIHPNNSGHLAIKAIFENPALGIDSAAPTASSAAVANATPTTVAVIFNEALAAGFVPATSAFAVSGHTVSAVAIVGSTVNLTVTAFVFGEAARAVAYTQPGTNSLRDAAGNLVSSFSGLAVTNSVGAVATGATMTGPSGGAVSVASSNITLAITPVGSNVNGTVRYTFTDSGGGGSFNPAFLDVTTAAPSGTTVYTPSATAGARTLTTTNDGSLINPSLTYTSTASEAFARVLAGFTAMTESGAGPYTYSGDGTGAVGATVIGGILNRSRPASTDASFSAKLVSASTGKTVVIGVQPGSTRLASTASPYLIYGTGGNNYAATSGGVANTVTNTVGKAAGDWVRMRISGTSLIAEVSKNSGSTWTTVYTWTGIATTQMYFSLACSGDAVVDTLTTSGAT